MRHCASSLATAAVVLLAACDAAPQGAPAEPGDAVRSPAAMPAASPKLSACKSGGLGENPDRQRKGPLPVPAPLEPILAADGDHYAVLTLGGETLCIDTQWIEAVDDVELSEDGRFLSFDWAGYEEFGHQIVDRTGPGHVIDTGVSPVFSPSGRRFAALDYSESGYGALNALGLWDIRSAGLAELARIDELPPLAEWRIDRWAGEHCLEISAVAFEDLPETDPRTGKEPRQHFVAREVGGKWEVRRSSGDCVKA
jgi:hypothetical protein